MISPREFLETYAMPAAELFRSALLEKHLAVHAISQFDILAEVVFLWTLRGRKPDRREGGRFRDELGLRHHALRNIRDAHDNHKHGELDRPTTFRMNRGQRPKAGSRSYMFMHKLEDRTELRPTEALVLEMNDGSELAIWPLLMQAEDAWKLEFARLELS